MNTTPHSENREIAQKARNRSQNAFYSLAAFLYGFGIILLLGVSGAFSAGLPMPWWALGISLVAFVAGERVAKLAEK